MRREHLQARMCKKMTEKTWNWWGKPTPQEDILEDLVRLREHTGEWPKPGDVVGIRHIRTEVDWNYYFVGYRDAIRQASERWCQQRGQAPKKKRKKRGQNESVFRPRRYKL